MPPKGIDAPATAALLGHGLTQQEAAACERDLAKVARAFGRAQVKVRRLRAALKAAERETKDRRREMRMLISVRRAQ